MSKLTDERLHEILQIACTRSDPYELACDTELAILELLQYRSTGLSPAEIIDHEDIFKAYRHVCWGFSPEQIKSFIQNKEEK